MYAYCGNNPVHRYDPSGELFITTATIGGVAVWKIGVALVGAMTTYVIANNIRDTPVTVPAYYFSSIRIKQKSKAQEQEIAKSVAKDDNEPKLIYRYGGTNPGNFVPSERDVITNSGLSFLTAPPPAGMKATVTTIEVLNATGVVRAYEDHPGHVRVDPVYGTLADWRAGGSTHMCTIAVKTVVIKWDGGK